MIPGLAPHVTASAPRGAAVSERGQATIEMAAAGLAVVAGALVAVQLLLVVGAQLRASRLADQAAVRLAEKRPLPASLRRDAVIHRVGHRVVVTVPVPSLLGSSVLHGRRHRDPAVSERGQVTMLASGAMLLLLLGGAVLFFTGQVDRAGGAAQRAADLSALAAGQALARNPDAGEGRLDDVAASVGTRQRRPAGVDRCPPRQRRAERGGGGGDRGGNGRRPVGRCAAAAGDRAGICRRRVHGIARTRRRSGRSTCTG